MLNDGRPTTLSAPPHAERRVGLSVVVITRNQAATIDRLLESVLAETAAVRPTEIVLVDSASGDATVDLAARHPIRILRLTPGQRLTAAAGRFVGFEATSGGVVLFLDGDMELCCGWLAGAMEVLESAPDVGAVTGFVLNVAPGTSTAAPPATASEADRESVELSCRSVGGMGLYRRGALEQVGSFNPGFYSDEEPELCLRLRRAGFRFVRLNVPAALHFVDSQRTLSSLVARRRRRLYLGYGQILRSFLGSDLLWPYLRARGYGLLPGLVLLAGLGGLLLLVIGGIWLGLVGWVSLLVAVIVLDALRKRSLYRACYSVLHRLFIVEGMVRGFFLPARGPADYRTRVEVVK